MRFHSDFGTNLTELCVLVMATRKDAEEDKARLSNIANFLQKIDILHFYNFLNFL